MKRDGEGEDDGGGATGTEQREVMKVKQERQVDKFKAKENQTRRGGYIGSRSLPPEAIYRNDVILLENRNVRQL